MVGVILPDCGGAFVPPDSGGVTASSIPSVISDRISEHGQNGIVLSGRAPSDLFTNTTTRDLSSNNYSLEVFA